jgi:membrane-associated phospholipid phosphatase
MINNYKKLIFSALFSQKNIIFIFLLINNFAFAQVDTCDCHKNRPFIFPLALTAYGALSIGNGGFPSSEYVKKQRNLNFPTFRTHIDDYLIYVPSALPFALEAAGIKSRHNMKDKIALYTISMAMNIAVMNTLKYTVRTLRPDGSTNNSFPSGHTAFAFGGAQFLHKEYGYKSPWYSILGYGTAATSGSLRILNNRHWFSDVVVGAGLAMLCTEITYRIYPKIKPLIFKNKTKEVLKAF